MRFYYSFEDFAPKGYRREFMAKRWAPQIHWHGPLLSHPDPQSCGDGDGACRHEFTPIATRDKL